MECHLIYVVPAFGREISCRLEKNKFICNKDEEYKAWWWDTRMPLMAQEPHGLVKPIQDLRIMHKRTICTHFFICIHGWVNRGDAIRGGFVNEITNRLITIIMITINNHSYRIIHWNFLFETSPAVTIVKSSI